MIDLSGKIALVTGASQGIGLACAHKLAEAGAHVVLAARNAAALQSAAEQLVSSGYSASAACCDVVDFKAFQDTIENCVAEHGKLDILVNNAGVIDPIARMGDSDPEVWGRCIDVNVKGVYHGLRAAIPIMEKQAGGTIINMSSGSATGVLEGWSHYCASKAAAKRLTECAHREYADHNIHVIGLSPGTVATEMMQTIKRSGVNPISQMEWSQHIPPQWVGEAVAFLCGPEGVEFAGTDFTIKTREGRERVGLPMDNLPG